MAKSDEIKIPDAETTVAPQAESQRDADRRQLWCDVVRIWFTRNHNIENAIGHAGTALRYFDEKFPAQ